MKSVSIFSRTIRLCKKVAGLLLLLIINLSFKNPKLTYLILIDKSDYRLTVYENNEIAGEYD